MLNFCYFKIISLKSSQTCKEAHCSAICAVPVAAESHHVRPHPAPLNIDICREYQPRHSLKKFVDQSRPISLHTLPIRHSGVWNGFWHSNHAPRHSTKDLTPTMQTHSVPITKAGGPRYPVAATRKLRSQAASMIP